MQTREVIAIFDIGKTNKKMVLFDPGYQLVWESSCQLEETTDADGFPCEDIQALTAWMLTSLQAVMDDPRYDLRAINCSAYGASFVLLDENGQVIAPICNYLKPYPEALLNQFYDLYGGRSELCRATASPSLGNLNSGLQLYRLKREAPELYFRLRYALHLPQYLAYLLTGNAFSEITSIGCHTHLWDFDRSCYHHWVYNEGIDKKLAPIHPSSGIAGYWRDNIPVGIGLHDSSAALIPYLKSFQEPFVLLSTGTWCISMNPFNTSLLTDGELQKDCLCYLSYEGGQVKASRLFSGYEHEQQVKKLAAEFDKPLDYYKHLRYDPASDDVYEKAYHRLVEELVNKQVESTGLVLEGNCKRIFVDGGFSRNDVYMKMLAAAFPGYELLTADVAQASALGAAMAIHEQWNT